ncbi:MAG: hypothetical protein LBU27_09145 [Candidatus Peribacteria bacterium]|jgi:hypothetical protein|nr:hypothetical protein [Candidatus Peribacteria bacterium]
MTERVSMINSNITQLNSDFDFSAALLHLFGGEGGVLFLDGEQKAEFKLQG